MTRHEAHCRRYLVPKPGTPWRWTDGGDVLAWRDGETIAFRDEVRLVLERSAADGLPPFAAVALVLAACRGEAAAIGGQPWLAARLGTECGLPDWAPELALLVERVASLPAELRTTPAAKAELVATIFEGTRDRLSPNLSRAVVGHLAEGGPLEEADANEDRTASTPSLWAPDLLLDLRSLRAGLQRFDPATFASRLTTGLDVPVRAAPTEEMLPPVEAVRRLLAELNSDRELSGLAKLARDLMAVVHLPRAVSDREDLPLGGVSDIANRGSLDRLLPTELVHDDLTLAVRIAVGEALYLRRESPPKTPPLRRAILVDAGLRLWGVPRVFATAVALSFAATGDAGHALTVRRARRDGTVPIDLTTRSGLTEHLAALETHAHPAAAVKSFLDELRAEDARSGTRTEAVLITAEDVLSDPDFRRALAEIAPELLHVAAVARDGRFELSAPTARGSRVLRSAVLKLDGLFDVPTSSAPPSLVEPHADRDLPAIFHVDPFPLLLPHAVDLQDAWDAGPPLGVLAVSKDRRLTQWERPGQGGRQLTDRLPPGPLIAAAPLGAHGNGPAWALVGRRTRTGLRLVRIEADGSVPSIAPLECTAHGVQHAEFDGEHLYVAHPKLLEVFDVETAHHLGTVRPGTEGRFITARLVRGWRGWGLATVSGNVPRIEWLRFDLSERPTSQPTSIIEVDAARPTSSGTDVVVAVFLRRGREGPLAVTSSGRIVTIGGTVVQRLPMLQGTDCQFHFASRDGNRVAYAQMPGSTGICVCSLADGTTTAPLREPSGALEPIVDQALRGGNPGRTLRSRFTEALRDARHGLVLRSKKGRLLRVTVAHVGPRPGMSRLRLVPCDAGETTGTWHAFVPLEHRLDVGYSLSHVDWEDGTRIVADSRGLLHVRSRRPDLPEATLVLYDDEVSVWCSDGRVCGGSYFLGPLTQWRAEDIEACVLRPLWDPS